MKRLAAIILIILSASSPLRVEEEYDPQHTMLALNMVIVSINRIVSTQDRIILDQECNTIINKLALGNIESDYKMTGLYAELMNFITGKGLRQEEAQRFQERYNRREQAQLENALSGIRAYGGNLWSWLGSLATSCVSSYFSYQSSKAELLEGLNDDLWQLKKEDIEDCNELQVKLLNSSWNLLRQYKLPDEYRLTQESLNGYYKAVNEAEPSKRLRMLRARNVERNFQVYPPYWYYRAKAAQESGDDSEALKCWDKFAEVWRPVLRNDPYKLEEAKFRVQRLAGNVEGNRAEIRRLLGVIQDNTMAGDWSNNLFAGVVYFLLGDKDEGIACVEVNTDFEFEREISGAVLAQMKTGKLSLEVLPNELRGVASAFEERKKLLSEAQDKDLALALTNYFEGNEKSAGESLERMAETSSNPVVFHALKIREYTRKTSRLDYTKIEMLEKRVKELRGKKPEASTHYKAILPLLEHYAGQKNDCAMLLLGDMYQGGLGVEKDNAKALDIFRVPAENGNAYGQLSMGVIYEAELERYSDAVKWFSKAADKNDAYAQFILGIMYLGGKGIIQDDKKAAELLSKASDQGVAEAQNFLGNMYLNGVGVTKDEKKAFELYMQAAEHGLADAQENLGDMYLEGKGVEQDIQQALKWIEKAAEQGSATSQVIMGGMYEFGLGVEVDLNKAREWYQKAVEQGNEDTKEALKRVESEIAEQKKDIYSDTKVGDILTFGTYEQNNDPRDGKEAIEWIVLAKNEGRFLLMSRLPLDVQPYNDKFFSFTSWEECSLRKWLNDTFMRLAFNDEQKTLIHPVMNSNPSNPKYGTSGGNYTLDSVFVLSINEIETYLPSKSARSAEYISKYAAAQDHSYFYWLRTPGFFRYSATGVDYDGEIKYFGSDADVKALVRPCLWVNAQGK